MLSIPFDRPAPLHNTPVVISIGVFDGVHLGHRSIISALVEEAVRLGSKSVVFTFSVNPKMLLGREKAMGPIISDEERNSIFASLGVDYVSVIDFSSDFSKLSGEEFIARLCTLYNVQAMVVGSDFRCGNRDSSVGVQELPELLSRYTSSAYLRVVPFVYVDEQRVSSSLIRGCLLTGDRDKASRLLGRAYSPRGVEAQVSGSGAPVGKYT